MNSVSNTSARRTAWMAARARNAARRGGLVAGVGIVAVTATLLVLVLVPREVNRTVRARIDALPAPVDTLPLLANLTGATDRLKNAEANLQALRVADADRVATAAASGTASSIATAVGISPDGAEQSDARKELAVRVARARTAPLVENFRAVGEAELLRNDTRARTLLDSLTEVNRDREAYAALGGADARYAALTAKLASLGQRLLGVAEQRLANPASAPAVLPVAPVEPKPIAPVDSTRAPADSATLSQAQRFNVDSVGDRAAREALDSAKTKLQEAEVALKTARDGNTSLAQQRADAEAASPAQVPPLAMLVAALILGLAVGYGAAFYIEVKHPRVADAAEVERVTDTRVIVHSGSSGAALNMRHRRQSDEALPRVVDTVSEAFQLLHVTLTGFGDTARQVQVLSSEPILGATVGINLAAAAARDSRATLLVDASMRSGPVARLLHNSKASGLGEARANPSLLRSLVVRTRVGRDLFVDTMFGGTSEKRSSGANAAAEFSEQLVQLANEHDFTVVVQPDIAGSKLNEPLVATDIVLCARMGVSSLEWLVQRTSELRALNFRVRAVLLWATRAPSVR